MPSFMAIPAAGRFRLSNATVVCCLTDASGLQPDGDGLARAGLLIEDGRVVAITPPDVTAEGFPALDLDGGMALPCFVDAHTHLDKGHIWPRRRNPDGTFMGALTSVGLDREANWVAEDVAARMEFGLRSAYAHGTSAIRTHLDSIGPQVAISWPVFAEMRERWKGRIDLQAASLFSVEHATNDDHMAAIAATVVRHGGVLGAVAYVTPDLDHALDRIFRLAVDHGLELDFHVDETNDPAARALSSIAEAAIRHRFQGRILCGHCCTLSLQDRDEERRIIDRVAEARIAVVSLPMCNMYLQDRKAGRTPRWRGVTSLHELAAAGIDTIVASDNTRDPFYAYGDLDMLEVFREATRIGHFDHPFGDWPGAMARTAARVIGRPDHGMIRPGGSADLVLFRARSWTELLARPQADRIVLRAGHAIDRTLPDYRELDEIMGRA